MTDRTLPQDMTLLLVDDDKPFLTRLARAMETRGFAVRMAETVAEGVEQVKKAAARLCRRRSAAWRRQRPRRDRGPAPRRPDARAVVLTGYGNIATAVTAVKLGAIDYLAKPADADAVYARLTGRRRRSARRCRKIPMSADRVRWEHIQRVYELCNRNVSETARRLNMHRRTLQRILAKRAPR